MKVANKLTGGDLMNVTSLQATASTSATDAVTSNSVVQSGAETAPTAETKDKYSSKLAEIASRYDVTKITPRQMLALSKELYDNKLISETEYAFMSFQPEVWDPNAPQTYPGPKKLGPDDPRDFLSEWKTKATYQRSAEATNNAQNVINALEKVNALPHDNVVASSSSKSGGGSSSEISGALTSEIQKAVSSYRKGISESTLDTEKMAKLLEALNAHRKPVSKSAAT
jgi:hypothetical protein